MSGSTLKLDQRSWSRFVLPPRSCGKTVVVSKSNYWEWDSPMQWKNQIPQAIVDAFESEGFAWGGRWYHYDTMHFEYRPELLDPTCYAD